MLDVGLGTLVTYNPTIVTPEATLAEVAELLGDGEIHHLPVVDCQRQVVGIISSLDVERLRLRNVGLESSDGAEVRARDMMQSPVLTVDQNDCSLVVLKVLLANRIHSVPVVADGRLVGIVTSTDFLRELSYGDEPMCREPLNAYLSPESAHVSLDDSIENAISIMDVLLVDYLAVVAGRAPSGIVARRDLDILAGADGTGRNATAELVACLKTNIPTVHPTERLGNAVRKMLDLHAPAVLVVNRAQQLLGLVSQESVLQGMASAMEEAVMRGELAAR
ncbi:MAG: CBS domain-containing protein [Planctomycetia bacterium]|nr:CBS domain-containing protein [Planctomycetia bacterium]